MKMESVFDAIFALLFAVLIGAFLLAAYMRERRDAKQQADFLNYEKVFLEGGVK